MDQIEPNTFKRPSSNHHNETKSIIMDEVEPNVIELASSSKVITKSLIDELEPRSDTRHTTLKQEVSKAKWIYKEPIPLIPKLRKTVLPSSDCSHLIRQIFQEELRDDTLPLQTATNLLQTSKTDSDILEFANQVTATYSSYDAAMDDILLTEKGITGDSNESPDNASAKKFVDYSLIQTKDLLPETYERVVDYKMIDTRLVKNTNLHPLITKNRHCPSKGRITKYDYIRKYDMTSHIIPNSRPSSAIFIAEPNQVFFTNCEAGKLTERRVKLKNISSSVGRFNLVPFPNDSKFSVYLIPLPGHTKMVAPGMAATLVVQFTADIYDDKANESTLHVNVFEGDEVKISINSYRDPPMLIALPILTPPCEDTLNEKELMLIETIEIGNCFVGHSTTITIQLYNYGGKGRFWICSEEGWSFSCLRDISVNNVLYLSQFSVTPFFFSIAADEVIDLDVTFTPTEFGLQAEKLCFLCDNCVMRSVELIGDAIIYERNFITFDNMEKVFDVNKDDDERCEHWLDLGNVVLNQIQSKEFTVTNNSSVNLLYRWERRKAIIQKFANENLLDLPDRAYFISPDSGEIALKSTTTFTLTCRLNQADIGQYRHVLQLVIANLPKGSITKDSLVETITNNSDEMIDVITGEVEVWLKVVPLVISLDPCIICITGDSLKIGKGCIQSTVYIKNHSSAAVKFHWKSQDDNSEIIHIDMYPKRGKIQANSHALCVATIQALYPGDFRRKIQCIINHGEQNLDLVVQGEVDIPTISASIEALDFGIVPHSCCATMTFQVNSKSEFPAVWRLQEYRFHRQSLVQEMNNHLTSSYGYLCHRDSECDITYYLDTSRPGLWCSLLVLSSVLPRQCIPNAYILVSAIILAAKMRIMAPKDNTAILTVYERLYVGIPTDYSITMRNMTQASSHFYWDTPTGTDAAKLKVRFTPKRNIVSPADNCTICVTITPLDIGDISQFYVPCYVGYNPIPVILSIVCQVDCLNVTFHMPARTENELHTENDGLNVTPISWSKNGRDINYPWIKTVKKSYTSKDMQSTSSTYMMMMECLSMSNEIEIKVTDLTESTQSAIGEGYAVDGEIRNNDSNGIQQGNTDTWLDQETRMSEQIQITDYDVKESSSLVTKSPLIEHPCIQLEDEINEKTKEFLYGVPRDIIEVDKASKLLRVVDIDDKPVSTTYHDTTYRSQSREMISVSKASLLEYLGSNAIIEFHDTPCFEPVSKMFVVRNETPLPAVLSISVLNYPEEENEVDIDLLANIESKLRGLKPGDWSARVRKGCGIVVVTKQCTTVLEAFSVVPVTVWVYANTWGLYRDTITCQLTGLPPFEIQVFAQVTGNPISFPMAPKWANTVPILRFGNLRYRNEQQARKVRITNSSNVDICILWTTLVVEGQEESMVSVPVSSPKIQKKLFGDGSLNNLVTLEQSYSEEKEDEYEEAEEDVYEPEWITSVHGDMNEEKAPNLPYKKRVYQTRVVHSTLMDIPMPPPNKNRTSLFQVADLKLLVPARSEAFLPIIIDPTYRQGRIGLEQKQYRGTLTGYVQIHADDRYNPGKVYRRDEQRVQPVILRLEATLDVPHLAREDCQSDVHITVSVTSLLALPKDKYWTTSQVLLFKNDSNTTLTADLSAAPPFRVIKATTLGDKGVKKITVLPGQRVEVLLGCKIDRTYAEETVKIMENIEDLVDEYKTTRHETALTFEYELKITQNELMTQVMTLYVTTLCPTTYISNDNIVFGQVYVMDTKKMYLRIENKSDTATTYSLKYLETCPEYVVTPMEGIIPATIYPDIKMGVDITISFTPTNIADYKSILLLSTFLEETEIRLHGYGTRNEAYCVENY